MVPLPDARRSLLERDDRVGSRLHRHRFAMGSDVPGARGVRRAAPFHDHPPPEPVFKAHRPGRPGETLHSVVNDATDVTQSDPNWNVYAEKFTGAGVNHIMLVGTESVFSRRCQHSADVALHRRR